MSIMGMKFVNDRRELAEDINIKGVPVLTMNLRECMKGYEHCYGGSKVRVGYQSRRHGELHERCTLKMYGDERGNTEFHDQPWLYQRIILSCPGCFLSGDFTLHDAREMVEWSNTKVLHEGDELYVFFDRGDKGLFRKMRVGKVSSGCSTVAVLEDIDDGEEELK